MNAPSFDDFKPYIDKAFKSYVEETETLIMRAMVRFNCGVEDLILEVQQGTGRVIRIVPRAAGWRWADWQSDNHGWASE